MIRFLTMPESPVAYELVRRLDEKSIAAKLTTEHSAAGLHTGFQRNAIIWLEDPNDADRARDMYRLLEADHVSEKCPLCGYSLAGHSGQMRCPECGYEATAPVAEITCPSCGETGPANFDICWNCSTALRPNTTDA